MQATASRQWEDNEQLNIISLPGSQGALLWAVDLKQAKGWLRLHWLSSQERERATLLRSEDDARRYLLRRQALRQILAVHMRCHPTEVEIGVDTLGRPYLPRSSMRFSTSYSNDWALIGLHPSCRIGVSIELEADESARLDLVVCHHFTNAERQALLKVPDHKRRDSVLQGWARKSACVKALGGGLATDRSRLDVGIHGTRQDLVLPLEDGHSQVVSIESIQMPDVFYAESGSPRVFAAIAVLNAQRTDAMS